MSTKTMLISDLMLRLQNGKPSDDYELSRTQAAFWLSNIKDQVIKEYIDTRLEERIAIDDYFFKQESCKAINEESDPCIDEDAERIYIRLKYQPLDLYKDMGVVRLRTSEGSTINKAKINTIDIVGDLEFGKPSVRNLVYYRDGKTKIVIEGIPKGLKDTVEIIVWYIPKEDLLNMNDDDEVRIPSELIPELMERAEELGRRQMSGMEDDINNGLNDIAGNGG